MRIYLLVMIFVIPFLLHAQRTFIAAPNNWQLIVIKQDRTWDWRGKYRYHNDQYEGPGIKLDGNFYSNILYPNEISQKWRDSHELDGFFYFKSGSLIRGIYAQSWLLTDRQFGTILGPYGWHIPKQIYLLSDIQKGTVNTYGNHVLGFKAIYNLEENISVNPYLGYQQAQNKEIIEWGWDLGIRGKIRNYPLGNYRTSLDLVSDYDFYRERQNSINALDIGIKTRFSQKARDSLSVAYSQEKQQYFTSNADYLVNVDIENKQLLNFLYYSLSNRSRLELHTFLHSRNIIDDNPAQPNVRDILRIENRINFSHFLSKVVYSLGLHTYQENLDNGGRDITTDSKSMQTTLKADVTYLLSGKDQFDLQFSFVKFQYDTPDSVTNNDDRDELRLIGLLRYSRQFSPLLKLYLEAYLNFYHKIYVFEEQSANNNWNRIYRLGAVVKYQNHKWRNSLKTQVLANYTVYDFEQIFNETRSFIFRKYILSDSLVIPLFTDLSLGIYGRLELEDRGTFYKSEFGQKLLESNVSTFYDFYLERKNILLFDFVFGVAIYQHDGWRHVPFKRKERDVEKISPYLRLFYPLGRNLRFVSTLSINYLRDLGRLSSNYKTGNITLYYHF